MEPKEGPLVLADISGYTAFVAETELEHSREILNELLEGLVRSLAKHVRIGQIEGDAVFGLGERMPPKLLEWLRDTFVRFQRQLRDITTVTSCPCRACQNVGSLTLKLVVHHGKYLPQSIGGKETFVGTDVNAVHRLLKNHVPSREYVLATRAVLERLPESERAAFTPHQERYEQQLGAIEGGYLDLTPVRQAAWASDERRVIEERHARLALARTYRATKDQLWEVLIDPAARQRLLGVKRVDYQPGARHSLVGGEFHCIHGAGDPTVFRVLSAEAPSQLTIVAPWPVIGLVWCTSRLEDAGPGRTRLCDAYHWERRPGVRGLLRDALGTVMVRQSDGAALRRVGEILAERAREPVPA